MIPGTIVKTSGCLKHGQNDYSTAVEAFRSSSVQALRSDLSGEETGPHLGVSLDRQGLAGQALPQTQFELGRGPRDDRFTGRLATPHVRPIPLRYRGQRPLVAGVGGAYADLPGDRRREPAGEHPRQEALEDFVPPVGRECRRYHVQTSSLWSAGLDRVHEVD